MKVDKKGEWMEVTIPEDWTGLSIEYILKEIWKTPKGLLHQLRMEKGATVNGELIPWTKEVKTGERLLVHVFPKEEYGVIPNYHEINILYEDDHLLIVDKPAGIEMHPAKEGQTDTMANALAFYFQMNGLETKIRHIHRLDKDTTGAVLYAKNALAGSIMDRLLERRLIKRTYLALVHGKLKNKKGKITEPIGKDRHHPSKRRVSPTGQEAVTYYEVLQYDPKQDITLIKLQLQTGRTHQIRVHMSHLGHPIVGDRLYGEWETRYEDSNFARPALHAAMLTLPHPILPEEIKVVAPFLDQPTIFDVDIQTLLG